MLSANSWLAPAVPDLRTGVTPWAMAVLAAGVGLILVGTYKVGVGQPRRLTAAAVLSACSGLGVGVLMLTAIGLSFVLGMDILNSGETLVSALGTLVVSVATLVALPLGLTGFSFAVAADGRMDVPTRVLPLLGTIAFLSGPVAIAFLGDASERSVLIGWPLALAVLWSGFGVLAKRRLTS